MPRRVKLFHSPEGAEELKAIASKMLSKSLLSHKNLPSWLQNAPKGVPRASQEPSNGPQEAPKNPQEAACSLPRAVWEAPNRRPKAFKRHLTPAN